MTSAKIGTVGSISILAGIIIGSFSLLGTAANASTTAQKCKIVDGTHSSLVCQCVIGADKHKKPTRMYYTSVRGKCETTGTGGIAPVISLVEPPKKGKAHASNSSTILSVGVGTSFGISGGLVLGNSNSEAGSVGSSSANADGSANGAAGGIGSGGFSAGGAGGSTTSSASTN